MIAVDATGHIPMDPVMENEIEADCVNEGYYEEVIYCEVCYEELSRDFIDVDALGHTEVIDEAVAPDCDDTGLTEGSHCDVCGDVIKAQEVVEATGHTGGTAVIENETAADCDTAGSYESVVYCEVCGEEVSRDTVPVEALGHKAGGAVKENETAADCDTAGSYESVVYCTECGEELSRDTVPVDALGHTEGTAVIENEVAPGCVNGGSYDSVVYCTVCGEELDRETIPVDAAGHTYDDDYDDTCNVCGDVRDIAKADAVVSIDEANIPDDLTYGDGSFSLGAWCEAEGENGVWKWTSSNPDVLDVDDNGEVTVVGAGRAYITASYESDRTEGRAATAVITVEKAEIVITASDKNITAGDELPELDKNDYTVEGLIGSDELITLPEIYYEAITDASTAGRYDIIVDGAEATDNYSITYVNGTLTVEAGVIDEEFEPGDANHDRSVDSTDAVLILRNLAGFVVEIYFADTADFNGDGYDDSSDAVGILRKLAGLN